MVNTSGGLRASGVLTSEVLLQTVQREAGLRGVACVGRIALDNARDVNEKLGREAGDVALGFFKKVLTATSSESSICALARTEYLVHLPGMGLSRARDVIESVIGRLASHRLDVAGVRIPPLVASAGVVSVGPDSEVDVMATTGRLLRYARQHGGGRVATPADADLGTRHILVAEDDELTATLLRHILKRSGWEVTHYLDGREALAWAREHDAALILSDVKMPGMDGYELIQELRALPRHRRTPIVLVSSMSRDSDLIRGLELGANDYVKKPFSPDELSARLKSILGPIDREEPPDP